MKLAFLIPHYGLEINEPLEIYCRTTAENLYRRGIDVTIYTITDGRKEGEYVLNGVLIKRFKTEKSGDFSNHLIKNLKENEKEYDALLFFGSQNQITFKGVEELKGKKILIPYLYSASNFDTLDLFSKIDGIVFMTERERLKLKFDSQRSEVIEFGIDIKDKIEPHLFRKRYFILSDYILCQKEENFREIIEKFLILKKNFPFVTLILKEKFSRNIPFDPEIKYMELRDQKERLECIKGSLFTLLPSFEDRPDFLFFESMSLGVPVVVNQRNETLLEYCIMSNGGLWYSEMEEFFEVSSLLIKDKFLRRKLGRQAQNYIKENHSPEKIFLKWKEFLNSII